MTSDLTESEAFEGSFVQEIAVEPRIPTVRYTIPTRWTARPTTETPRTSSCLSNSQYRPDWLPGEESNLH